jgi:hypothetical protein
MMKTIPKNSSILILKSKFFLYRIVSYFSFLLIPVLVQKSLHLNSAIQAFMMSLYIFFMLGQWFLLGKEIDHRFKIYFKVNSSIDRIVYRLMLGMITMIMYFNLLAYLPSKWINNIFWVTWVVLGIFYSWPTRGKIIQESVTSNFTEYRYLDRFEKTLVGLCILMFVTSIPEFPSLLNKEALKLFFDPMEKFSHQIWNFLTINYYPFRKYPALFKIAWCMHFYVVGMGMFLITFYAFLRFFVSRRLSLLGVFAVLSSWSFSKILGNNFGASLTTTYSLTWVWTLLWVAKSSTYRSGLFLGLISYLGSVINQSFSFLVFIQVPYLYFYLLRDKTYWYKRQVIKYSILGVFLTLLTLISNLDSFENLNSIDSHLVSNIFKLINRKAFFGLAIFGVLTLVIKIFWPNFKMIKNVKIDSGKVNNFTVSVCILILYSFFFDSYLIKSFSIMWIIAFLSVLPLEVIFQTLTRLRSRRNIIYLIYIIICLLDSHFEGRVKIFLRMFKS